MKFMIKAWYSVICNMILIFMVSNSQNVLSQQELSERIPKNTKLIYVVDSVQIANDQVSKIVPSDIATVIVVKGKSATDLLGTKAKDGIVYIETKQFAKKRYWRFFAAKLANYSKILPNPDNDSHIQYVLDGRILKKDYEGELSTINDNNIRAMAIIPKDTLLKRYGIYRKQFGVEIFTK